MKFNVTDIEFDFDDGNDGESYALTFDEEIALRDTALGIYEADDEDDLIEIITDGTGYCIKSIELEQYDRSISVTLAGCFIASSHYNYSITNKFIMIFENTWQGETVLHEAFIDDNADVSIREVTLGGDPIEDFVSYHPNIGASDDELTKICDDIYQTLMGAFVAQMMEVA